MKTLTHLLVLSLLSLALAAGCSSTPDAKQDEAGAKTEAPATSQTSAQELFIQGNDALDQKKWAEAVRLYERAIERDDSRWDIYMNKAIAHSAQQHFNQAIDAIDKALANGGQRQPEVYFNLGNVYQNRGLYAQSVKAFRTSLAMRQGQHVDTLANIAASLTMMREYDKARQAYEHLRSVAPDDPRAYLGLGLIAHAREQNKEALEYYERANQMDPDYAQAWFNKGALLYRMKRFDESASAYQRYLDLAPDGPYAGRARRNVAAMQDDEQ